MKKLFFAFVMLLSAIGSQAQEKEDRDFGVIIFYRIDKGKALDIDVSINNLRAVTLTYDTRIIHKIYSEGSLLLRAEANMSGYPSRGMNLEINNFDTVYIRVSPKLNIKTGWLTSTMTCELNIDLKTKAEYLLDLVNLKWESDFKSQENLVIPYNPITRSKMSKGVERSGSGFLISEEGYILTNFHVIDGTKSITIKGVNGNPNSSLSASIVLKDEANDLALLKLDDRILLDSIKYSIKKEQADVGQIAYVLGYPMPTTMGSEIKLTNGLVSSKSGYEGNINSYQISAAVQGGNSGGPVFDDKGNIIAIVNAKHLDAENVTYAIKSKYLFDLIESSNTKINIHTTSKISNKSLAEQTKELSNFVYMIIAK